ncbi:MAG: GTP-binding protein [Candidatus Lokiarchaeota archaeon]|nr:GTP-binding protein [Candidatus Lokiarchaeota archaeon]
MASSDYTFKLIIVGDASTGKTSLTHRYLSGIFVDSPRLTIGVDFFSKKIKTKNGKRIKLQIWDFGGEERYRFLLPTYSKGANGALILYDITSKPTIYHIPDYVKIIRENAGDIPIMLIGSKVDLEDYRQVKSKEGIQAAKKNVLASFSELSSKTNLNVEESFRTIVDLILEYTESQ